MNSSFLKNRKIVEILSITGIMALFTYIDVKFGVLAWANVEIVQIAPNLKNYMITLVGSLWVGLLAYSYYKRAQSRWAIRAKNFIEAKFEKQKLVNVRSGLSNREGFEAVLNDTTFLQDHPFWTVLGIKFTNLKTIKNIHGQNLAVEVEKAVAHCISGISSMEEFLAHDDKSIFYLVVACEAEDEVTFRIDQIVETISLISQNGIKLGTQTFNPQFEFAQLGSGSIDQSFIKQERDGIAKRIGYALDSPRKQAGRSVVDFDRGMEVSMRRRVLIESTLQTAIKNGEIVPYFQPFIDMKTDRVIGFELLARWLHPTEGTIPPLEFIPVAEAQGILGEMTASILERACTISNEWPDHIILALNISPTNLRDNKLITRLIQIMRDTGVNPDRIEFEITENAFIDETGDVEAAVSRLKEQGISISIDDFGTGYSSLKSLRLLPFDKIKIDQSFIKDIATNPDSRAIVKNIIALGESLGMSTIAEGVEFGDNRDVLTEMGCAIGQGHLYAKALPEDDVCGFLEKYTHPEKLAVVA